jgi:ribonucleotide reductase alpha subunit
MARWPAIDRIPQDLRDLYATAFEIDPSWLVEAASRRQKWIDQAQSLNIYMAGASGKKLDETYRWPGSAASRPLTTCVRWAPLRRKNRPPRPVP